MVKDQQVRRLFMYKKKEKYQYQAADKAGMTEHTAYKYIKAEKLPSQLKREHDWQTREDPFAEDWAEIVEMLGVNPGLEGKTIFEHFQRNFPGRYQDGQVRTLQRRIKHWKTLEGPAKEIYFPQVHHPGDLSASDFTHMNSVCVTI
ncbi:MAG: IS21 family transposase, partial [Nanoarchaeota archaeon]|nr:IS21 family transposase [Nanoarchaeota archaeon]